MIYVELWFDAEVDREWKITLWQISDYDFDPFTAPYITLDIGTDNQHVAREMQLSIVRDLKQQTSVVANAYIDRSRFLIRPRWFEELLSPLGGLFNNELLFNQSKKYTKQDKTHMLSYIQRIYTVWVHSQMGKTSEEDNKCETTRKTRSIGISC